MEPYEWGPTFWRTLHTITFYYPDSPSEAEVNAARNLFSSLVLLLPCDECCEHFGQLLEQFPMEPALVGRQELSHWLYNLHDAVNQRLEKKPSPPYDQIRAEYLKLKKNPAPISKSQPAAKKPQQPMRSLAKPSLPDRTKLQEIENRRLQFEQIRTRTVTARASGTDVSRTGCKDCAQKRLARAGRR